jgi:hypothetical protein
MAVALSVVALGGVVYVVAVDRRTVSTGEQEARKKNLFPAWRSDDLTRVVLETPTGSATLSRTKAEAGAQPSWTVTIDGVEHRTEEPTVDKLLQTLEHATFAREIPSGSVDRAAFGLDAPRTSVDVTMGSLSFTLAIGSAAPTKGEAYAEVKGRGVYAVPMGLVDAIEIDPSDLRSKTFIPYPTPELDEIDLSGEGGDRAFVRAGWTGGRGSGFRMKSAKGDGVRVDGDVLDKVLVAFGSMQANAFVDDATADLAAKSRVVVTLVPKQGPKGVIAVGGPCPTKKDHVLAIRREPSRLNVCVPAEVLGALTRPAEAFEDRAVVGAHADEVTELRIVDEKDGRERRLEIARSGSGFKMRAPEDKTVSGERGGAFLRVLLDARGDLLPPDAPKPEGKPTLVRILSQGGMSPTGRTGERAEEIEVYPPKDERSIVLRKEDGRMLSVPLAVARNFAVSDLLVRDLEVLKLSPDAVRELAVDGAGKKQRLRRNGSSFELVEPKGKGLSADNALALQAITKVATLTTPRWIADADDGTFGLATPRFTIELDLDPVAAPDAGAGSKVTLLVGARTDDGSYGRVSTDPGVFLVPGALEDLFSAWLVSRNDFLLPTVKCAKLHLREAGGKELSLVREGNAFRVPGASDRRAVEAAADVQQALEELLPLAAVTVGPEVDYQGFKKPSLTIDCTGDPDRATYRIGAGDTFEGTSVFYARRDGIDATFAVPQAAVRPLFSALGVEP